MTHPVIDSASSLDQAQLCPGSGRQSYRSASNGVPQRRFFSSSRKSGSSIPSSGSSRSSGGADEKYSKGAVNSVQVVSASGTADINLIGSVDGGSLGSAGDAPALLPVMQEACHQIQALSLWTV
jgi:hypothetical protein